MMTKEEREDLASEVAATLLFIVRSDSSERMEKAIASAALLAHCDAEAALHKDADAIRAAYQPKEVTP